MNRLYRKALGALRQGLLTEANNMFAELAGAREHDARFLSYRGLLLAIRERRISEGATMCKRAIALASTDPQMHLNLARLYSTTGQRQRAVVTLRRAIRAGVGSKMIRREIQRLSPRAAPPLPSLHRDHILNNVLGRLRARWFAKDSRPWRQRPAQRPLRAI